MSKYALPRFMSREEWEALSPDNLHWLKQAVQWGKFYPSKDAYINLCHPENDFKQEQESLYAYGKRIHSDYRKMYGVT